MLVRAQTARLTAVTAVASILMMPWQAGAEIVETTGSVHATEAPPSVIRHAWESDWETNVFAEQFSLTLLHDIGVDIAAPGYFDNFEDCIPGTIAAGTLVNSYLVHQDAVGSNGSIILGGTITFDQDILGVIIDSSLLLATDALFAHPGTIYPGEFDALRGLDFPGAADAITISSDMRTIELCLQTQVAFDHVRIITAVPTPGSLALLAVAALSARGRRRARA